MKFYAAVVAALVLSACHPNDTKVKTVKERIDSGELVVFSEPGAMLATCKNTPEWPALRGLPKQDRERAVLGKQQSIANPGNRACYRIGSKVLLDERKPALGVAQIQSIALGRLDKLRQDDLKGRYFSFREDFNGYVAALKKRMNGNETGYVYIINFAYVNGSAVDEKSIKDRDSGPDYDETTAAGTDLDKCDVAWKDLLIAPGFLQPIQEGQLKSYFKLGRSNCLKQGQVAELKDSLGDTSPVLATIKIKKVKRFKVAHIDAKYFDLNGYDFKSLHNFIDKSLKEKPAEYMTVVDFDLVTGSSKSAVLFADCPPAIHLTRPLDATPSSEIIVSQEAARCAFPGRLLQVMTVDDHGLTVEIPARVSARTEAPQSPTVTLTLERLDPTAEVAP